MTLPFFMPDWRGLPPGVGALTTVRSGGKSSGHYAAVDGGGFNLGIHVGDDSADVAANRAILRSHLPAEPVWLTQVHGNVVVDAAQTEHPVEADASVTARPGTVCVIQTADCLPVLFCDKDGNVVGAAHAGWRGLAAGVLENTVLRMKELGASEILAWLGPAIGPDAFEVGQDVVDAFTLTDVMNRQAFRPVAGAPGKYLADIYALARRRLAEAGVHAVSGGGFCTVTERDRFYSYRRDRTTGRMASLIWLK
jgi:polyphenol oxidase